MDAMNTKRKTPQAEARSESRIAAALEGMGCHGSGRSGGLGFAERRPCEGRAQPFTVNAGQGFKSGGVFCGDEALALPVIHGLLGDAQ